MLFQWHSILENLKTCGSSSTDKSKFIYNIKSTITCGNPTQLVWPHTNSTNLRGSSTISIPYISRFKRFFLTMCINLTLKKKIIFKYNMCKSEIPIINCLKISLYTAIRILSYPKSSLLKRTLTSIVQTRCMKFQRKS